MRNYFQAYIRMVKCCLFLGDIKEAETTLNRLIQFDPTNEAIAAEQTNLAYLQRFITEAEAAYNAKDYRKVKRQGIFLALYPYYRLHNCSVLFPRRLYIAWIAVAT